MRYAFYTLYLLVGVEFMLFAKILTSIYVGLKVRSCVAVCYMAFVLNLTVETQVHQRRL